MQVEVKYGTGVKTLSLSDEYRIDVLRPDYETGCEDEAGAVHEAISAPIGCEPLRDLVDPSMVIGIVFSDATRATPNRIILPPILSTLKSAGIPDESIILFNATGTHRRNTSKELDELLGADIANRYEIVQNVCNDPSTLTHAGTTTTGNEVYLNTRLVACDLRILTGYIEPHFFAGFSGGGKAIMPGCAGLETILHNHGSVNIDDPWAVWGELERNPIAGEVLEAARMAGPSFLVNVALNKERQITAVFAGDIRDAHQAGCRYVAQRAIKRVEAPYDLVITSNAGYPLDRNLYQSVKGMSAAARVVRPGGTILLFAECRDGIPGEGNFGSILSSKPGSSELLAEIRSGNLADQDVWQAQVLCKIAEKARLYLYSEKLTDEEIRASHCIPVGDIAAGISAITSEFAAYARICVLPEGPETIPSLQ